MTLRKGRFGPYVTDGETNASLRTGDDPDSITIERAAELLQDRRDRGPATRPTRARGVEEDREEVDGQEGRAKKTAATKSDGQEDGRHEDGRHQEGDERRRRPRPPRSTAAPTTNADDTGDAPPPT